MKSLFVLLSYLGILVTGTSPSSIRQANDSLTQNLVRSPLLSQSTNHPSHNPLEQLANMMEGTYNSGEQAAGDTTFFNITLNMHAIWKDRSDGKWLYVEQAMTTMLEKPYRQRIYRVTQLDGRTFESAIFALPHPEKYIGCWKKLNPTGDLTPEDLILRDGCEVVLEHSDETTFAGKTGVQTCASELRGAKYATSEVTIVPDQVLSWDRGFDDSGKQIWGAVKGPYRFKKMKTFDPAAQKGILQSK